jgi:hypothetical protein
VRQVMSQAYLQKYPWGAIYSNLRCGVKRASMFHLTYDEMMYCGLNPIPGPSLCVVRDPMSRFESEVRWRANFKDDHWIGDDPTKYVERMIIECEKARRYIKADVFSHCQPQHNYLYKGLYKPKPQPVSSGVFMPQSVTAAAQPAAPPILSSKNEPIEALCDYLLSDLGKHEELLKYILGAYVPRKNVSNKTDYEQTWQLTPKEKEWVLQFYKSDYDNKAIQSALAGNVLRKQGTEYVVLDVGAPFIL